MSKMLYQNIIQQKERRNREIVRNLGSACFVYGKNSYPSPSVKYFKFYSSGLHTIHGLYPLFTASFNSTSVKLFLYLMVIQFFR